MNSAGYRYAASDQAFYIPAVLRHLDPALFPRDARAHRRAGAPDRDRRDPGGGRADDAARRCRTCLLALYVLTLLLLFAGRHAARRPLLPDAMGGRRAGGGADAASRDREDRRQHAGGRISIRASWRSRSGCSRSRRFSSAAGARSRPCWLVAAFVHPTTAVWFAVWLAWRRGLAPTGIAPWLRSAVALGRGGRGGAPLRRAARRAA